MTMDMDTVRMSYEEMIDILKGLVFGTFDRTTAKEREALDIAIKALQTEPSTDVIELEPIAKEFDEFVQTKPNTKNVDKWCSMKMREILCDYFAKKCLEEIGE